ncbi:MobA/MobL family protein (plasmid) [Acidiphilium multivorum AIU301]|uniref:MobA/MobL family protein n=1 Tax=Acidiphilium multivorum (strain DSM 11245 / JCM 8867 / NBRC 100883 / AIU 301) TaxID=926570 RepID=F0J870_ACIMA|nr:MobQ family relaxase [Acidiphilium multivorum]BAJ83287.1 MobA/MobL family protein [Acidiphilium multivorum AIU301]GAN72725.1 mobilization protein essential for specific plasmid transfer MobA/MobL [Acidiphilium multivorum AIU301]
MRAVLAGQTTEGGRWHVASYHLSAKAVSRSTGRSAVGAAAYRSGERLTNERDGVTHDYTRKRGVLSSFIVAPAGAEAWASDRSGLWNRAEAAEARKDAKVAREYELALPAELSALEREALARQFAQVVVERFGVVADVALHAPHREGDQRNWHAHILTTTRAANENGLGAKTRVLDSPKTSAAEIEALREIWAEQINAALERAHVGERVDHRSFARRGLEQAPTVHLGPAATALERRGVQTGLGDVNRAVAATEEAREAVRQVEAEVIDLEAERERRADVAQQTHWRSLPLRELQWEVNTLWPDREAALATARMANPAYREAAEAAETAEAGVAKARLNLLEATETERSLKQKAERYRGNQGVLGRVRFWLQDKGVLEIPEWKRLQDQISETQKLAEKWKDDLATAEELNAKAKIAFNEVDSAIAGTVDEILAPELRRYEAARSVLDERIEEDRRRAAEAEAERRAEEIRQRVDAEIERELREAAEQRRRAETAELRQVVHDLDTITPNGRGGYRFAFVRGLDQQEKERREAILYADKEKTKEVLKEELQERQLQAKREQDRDLGYDMEP